MFYKFSEVYTDISELRTILNDGRFNEQFTDYVTATIYVSFLNDYFLYDVDNVKELKMLLRRYFFISMQRLIDSYFLYMIIQDISNTFNVSGGKETTTTQRTIDYTNDIFRKYAQTPTAVSPSTNFVDSYTDMQEKTTGNDNTEESVTKTEDKNVSDKEKYNFYKICNFIVVNIHKIFSNHFITFYDL